MSETWISQQQWTDELSDALILVWLDHWMCAALELKVYDYKYDPNVDGKISSAAAWRWIVRSCRTRNVPFEMLANHMIRVQYKDKLLELEKMLRKNEPQIPPAPSGPPRKE